MLTRSCKVNRLWLSICEVLGVHIGEGQGREVLVGGLRR